MKNKKPTSFRLSIEAEALVSRVAGATGLSQGVIVSECIRLHALDLETQRLHEVKLMASKETTRDFSKSLAHLNSPEVSQGAEVLDPEEDAAMRQVLGSERKQRVAAPNAGKPSPKRGVGKA